MSKLFLHQLLTKQQNVLETSGRNESEEQTKLTLHHPSRGLLHIAPFGDCPCNLLTVLTNETLSILPLLIGPIWLATILITLFSIFAE